MVYRISAPGPALSVTRTVVGAVLPFGVKTGAAKVGT